MLTVVRYSPTTVGGAFLVEMEPREDSRGFFARVFCAEEFAAHGLEPHVAQINNAFTARARTLRGLHYQVAPAGEAKLVRCLRGRVFDVLVDLRAGSSTFRRWFGVELSGGDRRMLYVPKGCAHGYLTLEDESELLYLASAPYSSSHERVLRWNDPAIGIDWPVSPVILSDKDRVAPDFDAGHHASGY